MRDAQVLARGGGPIFLEARLAWHAHEFSMTRAWSAALRDAISPLRWYASCSALG